MVSPEMSKLLQDWLALSERQRRKQGELAADLQKSADRYHWVIVILLVCLCVAHARYMNTLFCLWNATVLLLLQYERQQRLSSRVAHHFTARWEYEEASQSLRAALQEDRQPLENPAKVLIQQVEARMQRLEAFSAAMGGTCWSVEHSIPRSLIGRWRNVAQDGPTPMQRYNAQDSRQKVRDSPDCTPPTTKGFSKMPSLRHEHRGRTILPDAGLEENGHIGGTVEDDCELGLLRSVVKGFRTCSAGDELKLLDIFDTAEGFMKILEAMGASMKLGRVDFNNNIGKARTWYAKDPEKHAHLRAFLEAERASGMHKPGGVLRDPSGAIGTLWMRRSFEFVDAIVQRLVEGAPMNQAASEGYSASLEQFHGRILRGTFSMALRAVPNREDFLRAIQLDEASIERAGRCYLAASQQTIGKMKAIHVRLDLEDTRRV